jgi:hypothetical protein
MLYLEATKDGNEILVERVLYDRNWLYNDRIA